MELIWEEMFQKVGTVWTFEPADSAVFASNLFAEKGFSRILIPGVGYGRNAKPFIEKGMDVTGIEISKTAISLARENGLDFPIHQGSVNRMPFDAAIYDGIYCYALIHLLNQNDRRKLLRTCFNQLRSGGIMVFVAVSTGYTKLYENGKPISKNRFRTKNGLNVFFYDSESVQAEFGPFGLVEFHEVDEPVKHHENAEPMKFIQVLCRKSAEN